jgi:hypothetical protein
MGVYTTSPNKLTLLTVNRGFNLSRINDNGPGGYPTTNISNTGLITMNRVSSAIWNIYNNGVLHQQISATSTGVPNGNMYVLAINADNSGVDLYSSNQISFVYAGANLTNEQSDFANALNRYMNSISNL